MRVSVVSLLLAAAGISLVQGQSFEPTKDWHAMTKPEKNEVIPTGKKYTIEWTISKLPDLDGPVNLILMAGDSHSTLNKMEPIADKVDAKKGRYEWDVDDGLGRDKAYGIKIELDAFKDVFQWSNPFTISKGGSAGVNSTSVRMRGRN